MNPALLGMCTALVWGTHDLVAGVTSRRIGFLPTVLGSTLFGFLLLCVWLGFAGDFPSLWAQGAWVAYGSGFGYALATMFLFAALSTGPMSLGVPLAGSYPVTSLVLAGIDGVPPSLLEVSLALLVVAGVIIVAVGGDSRNVSTNFEPGWFRRTLMYGAAAHVFFALGIWWGQAAAVTLGTLETTWLSRVAGFILLLVLFLFSGGGIVSKLRFVPRVALVGCLDVVAISCLNFAGHTENPEIATVIGSAFGVVTVLLAWLFLKERVSLVRWFGIAVTFSGVALLTAFR